MNSEYAAFNGIQLANLSPYLYFAGRDASAMPKIDVDTESTARGQGSKIIQKNYREKPISVDMYILAPSRESLDQVLDMLKFRLANTQGTLDIVQSGVLRSYYCTLSEFNINKPKANPGKATLQLVFSAADPFGYDTNRTVLDLGPAFTVASKDIAVGFGGSWFAEPVLAWTINSGSGLTTNKTVSISNPATGEQISVTRNWSALDVLQIDSENRAVTINNAVIDYVGVFPTWAPLDGIIHWQDDFTTRNVSPSGYYNKRYL